MIELVELEPWCEYETGRTNERRARGAKWARFPVSVQSALSVARAGPVAPIAAPMQELRGGLRGVGSRAKRESYVHSSSVREA